MKRVLICILAICTWGSAVWSGSRILKQSDCISLRLEGEDAGVNRAALERMQEKYYAAAYAEAGLMTVTVPDTGRKAEVPAFRFVGDSRLITGGWPAAGSFGAGDPAECMISRETAMGLFGAPAAAGLVVAAGGQEWTVRGVFDSEQPAILLPADQDTLMTNLEFQFAGPGDHQDDAGQACYQYGITGEQIMVDYSFFGALARLLMWFPFLVLLTLSKRLKQRYASDGDRQALSWGLEIAFWAGILLFLFQGIRFPAGYIPAKWSDFHFWTVKWEEGIESVNILMTAGQMKVRILRNQLAACAASSAAAALLWHRIISEIR